MTEQQLTTVTSLESSIESLLFISDGPVSIDDLARTFEVEREAIETALKNLVDEYDKRGIRILRTRNSAQFVSAPEAAPVIQKFLGLEATARLSPAALETLAIIAYRQPVTRPQIESVRGVNSDGVMHSLLLRNLIQEVGRLETVGHPIQYGTTPDFLEYFGLTSFDEMPPLPEDVKLESETKDIAGFLRGREGAGEAEIEERERTIELEVVQAKGQTNDIPEGLAAEAAIGIPVEEAGEIASDEPKVVESGESEGDGEAVSPVSEIEDADEGLASYPESDSVD